MLNKLVSKFPDAYRPRFTVTINAPSPFPALHKKLPAATPDIACTQPGSDVPVNWTWDQCASVVQVETGSYDDTEDEGPVLLAHTAANLLISSGSCFVFILEVFTSYGSGRVFRFDRAGAVASAYFDWREDTEALTKYFWRLVHPMPRMASALPGFTLDCSTKSRIIGADFTVTIPSQCEKANMRKILMRSSDYNTPEEADNALKNSHWMEAVFEGQRKRCLTVGPPLSQSSLLFSRATVVWKVLLEDATDATFFALKDTWREMDRRSESTFYAHIEKKCIAHDRSGSGLVRWKGSVVLQEQEGVTSGHLANSRTLHADDTSLKERFHERSIFFPVGYDLTKFKNTRQLITAIRDVIKGRHLFVLL